jgi:hypothetical protein
MIFGLIECDAKYQIGEKVRINYTKSYNIPNVDFTVVTIKPSGSDIDYVPTSLVDRETFYMDWIYSTAGTKTITLALDDGSGLVVTTKDIEIVSAATDALFSTDADLIPHEDDILKWLPDGRSSWNYMHRKSQDLILKELYKSRIYADDGLMLTTAEVLDVNEIKEWSIFKTLEMIMNFTSNKPDDVFRQKAMYYGSKEQEWMNYALNSLKLDFNKDGEIDELDEKRDYRTTAVLRR